MALVYKFPVLTCFINYAITTGAYEPVFPLALAAGS